MYIIFSKSCYKNKVRLSIGTPGYAIDHESKYAEDMSDGYRVIYSPMSQSPYEEQIMSKCDSRVDCYRTFVSQQVALEVMQASGKVIFDIAVGRSGLILYLLPNTSISRYVHHIF